MWPHQFHHPWFWKALEADLGLALGYSRLPQVENETNYMFSHLLMENIRKPTCSCFQYFHCFIWVVQFCNMFEGPGAGMGWTWVCPGPHRRKMLTETRSWFEKIVFFNSSTCPCFYWLLRFSNFTICFLGLGSTAGCLPIFVKQHTWKLYVQHVPDVVAWQGPDLAHAKPKTSEVFQKLKKKTSKFQHIVKDLNIEGFPICFQEKC